MFIFGKNFSKNSIGWALVFITSAFLITVLATEFGIKDLTYYLVAYSIGGLMFFILMFSFCFIAIKAFRLIEKIMGY